MLEPQALIAWYYPGQVEIHDLLLCGSINEALGSGGDSGGAEGTNFGNANQ
jgi:hypothetical protein